MHTAVMTCDFLLAPAFCEPKEIECRVADLVEYARSIQARGMKPLLEDDASGKLIEAGNYPCDGAFKSNLAKLEEQIYTVKDISRVVTRILDDAEYFSYSEKALWESDQGHIDPDLSGLNQKRKSEILRLIEEIAVHNKLESKDYSILHFCKINNISKTTFRALLKEIVPPLLTPLPYELIQCVTLESSYRRYLTTLCLNEALSKEPDDPQLLKEVFYWGALCALKERDLPLETIDPGSFDLGPKFIESLKMNQCLPGQNFWGPCFSSIVSVLTDDPSYEVHIFKKSAKSEEQKTIGEFRAYRSHITKGTVGLRLMFWRDESSSIILANVGPKKEEEIESPE